MKYYGHTNADKFQIGIYSEDIASKIFTQYDGTWINVGKSRIYQLTIKNQSFFKMTFGNTYMIIYLNPGDLFIEANI